MLRHRGGHFVHALDKDVDRVVVPALAHRNPKNERDTERETEGGTERQQKGTKREREQHARGSVADSRC